MHSWGHLLLFTNQLVLGCYPVDSEIIGGHNKNISILSKDFCKGSMCFLCFQVYFHLPGYN